MASYQVIEPQRILMGKLAYGGDLLDELTGVCKKENITCGTVAAIGAVQKARIGYYDQSGKAYQFIDFDRHLEIASLIGNISLRDGVQMVHAHITLADEQGICCAGHLAAGTIVFACEFAITVCEGPDFVREHDKQTGLTLWRL